MALSQWLRDTVESLQRGDTGSLRDSMYQMYAGAWRRAGLIYNYGTPVYKHQWDLLVVLDACRYDLLWEVVNEYSFLDRAITDSVASATEEWIAKNFGTRYQQEVGETVYVTGNPHSAESETEEFEHVEEVWSHSWDDDIGTVLAEDVTDHAIAAGRKMDPDRCIVHYMQPHHPFVPTPELNKGIGFRDETEYKHIWEKLRQGNVSREDVWYGYCENLRYVLDSVAKLLENYDAKRVLVTADHGNALGEFGIYGHPLYVPIPALKRVPFCITSATDTGVVDTDVELDVSGVNKTVSDRLADLGYT